MAAQEPRHHAGATRAARFTLSEEERAGVPASATKLALAITPYFFNLIDRDNPDCPIRRQVIPRFEETGPRRAKWRTFVRRGRAHCRCRAWCIAIPTACSFS